MAGLRDLLEQPESSDHRPQIIKRPITIFISPPSPPPPPPRPLLAFSSFLQNCYLCRRRLLEGRDIYMYRGDKAFCSVECRCRQIRMDEEDGKADSYCSVAAVAAPYAAPSSSSRRRGRVAEGYGQ